MSNNTRESVIEHNVLTAVIPVKTNKKPQSVPLLLKLFRLAFRVGGRLSPGITSRIAYNLWLTPTRFKTPASEQAVLASATKEFHHIKQHKIATFHWGQDNSVTRPIILLVHGWAGRGTQLGPFVEPLVNAGYQVLSFDSPAHGQSSGKQTNLYEIADVIGMLQKKYGEFEAIITHSFGGPCTALAIQHGLHTERMVSICPPATTIGLVQKFTSTLHLTKKTEEKLIQRIEKTFGDHIWDELAMTNTIKDIGIPGFVIHDAQDSDIPWEEGQAVAIAWNNAPFTITKGLGHRRILKDHEVIASAVSFIRKK